MVLLGLGLDLGYPVPGLVHLVLEGGRLGLVEAPEVLLRLQLVLKVFPGNLVHGASGLHLVQLLLVGLGTLTELCQSFEEQVISRKSRKPCTEIHLGFRAYREGRISSSKVV